MAKETRRAGGLPRRRDRCKGFLERGKKGSFTELRVRAALYALGARQLSGSNA